MKQKDTMIPKERWEAILTGRKPDRIPMDYWATEKYNKKIKDYLK
ncbi:MAG: hypothetical protein ACOCP4_07260 [Candidatus Woesearchaeota archaeon]